MLSDILMNECLDFLIAHEKKRIRYHVYSDRVFDSIQKCHYSFDFDDLVDPFEKRYRFAHRVA